MVFASVSAHELRGGTNVSLCPTFVRIGLSLSPNTQSLTSYPSPTSYCSRLDYWWCWVTVHDVILPPQDLSDVAATNADRESHDWHPKTKFNADNLKGKGKTDLAGKGHKLYHETLITNILEENDNTKLGNYCDPAAVILGDCLRSAGEIEIYVETCFGCLDAAWNDVDVGTPCLDLQEVGYCDDIQTCWETKCHMNCAAETNDFLDCIVTNAGCTDSEFWNVCIYA